MSKKILVAGAGHGGIVCGALLAKQGYQVDVYESQKRRDIGYDWTDSFDFESFKDAGIPMPPEDKYTASHTTTYTNPNHSAFIKMPDTEVSTNVIMDRKYLIKYLIKFAEECGVKFHFGVEIVAPITDKDRILGLLVNRNGNKSTIFGDLIIDAAGMDSPVRTLLPAKFNILSEFTGTEVFTAYRAFFKRDTTAPIPDNKRVVWFYHMRTPGLDWVCTEEDYMDVLVGRFGGDELTKEQIDSALDDIRNKYPIVGHEIVRGGSVKQIPIRKTIPLLVANGYAAIGDSAAMTVPMIGSGIANSIRAGKFLADTILADENDEFTAKTLWSYQCNYFNNVGNKLVVIDKLRTLATSLQADDVDYLLEKEILSADAIALGTGKSSNVSVSELVRKLLRCLPKFPVLANATMTFAQVGTIKKFLSTMPTEYDKETVNQWAQRYNEL